MEKSQQDKSWFPEGFQKTDGHVKNGKQIGQKHGGIGWSNATPTALWWQIETGSVIHGSMSRGQEEKERRRRRKAKEARGMFFSSSSLFFSPTFCVSFFSRCPRRHETRLLKPSRSPCWRLLCIAHAAYDIRHLFLHGRFNKFCCREFLEGCKGNHERVCEPVRVDTQGTRARPCRTSVACLSSRRAPWRVLSLCTLPCVGSSRPFCRPRRAARSRCQCCMGSIGVPCLVFVPLGSSLELERKKKRLIEGRIDAPERSVPRFRGFRHRFSHLAYLLTNRFLFVCASFCSLSSPLPFPLHLLRARQQRKAGTWQMHLAQDGEPDLLGSRRPAATTIEKHAKDTTVHDLCDLTNTGLQTPFVR